MNPVFQNSPSRPSRTMPPADRRPVAETVSTQRKQRMRRIHLQRWGLAVLVMILCASCMKLGSTPSPETRFYLLGSVPATDASPLPTALPADIAIGIGPVTLPSYLDRPQIVTRLGGNRIRVDEFHRWGESLQGAIARVLGENLFGLTGASRVAAFPWRRSVGVDVQVVVDLLRFDADADGTVVLEARWQLLGGRDTPWRLAKHTAIVRPSSGDYGPRVDAMGEALMALSREIGIALTEAWPRGGGAGN